MTKLFRNCALELAKLFVLVCGLFLIGNLAKFEINAVQADNTAPVGAVTYSDENSEFNFFDEFLLRAGDKNSQVSNKYSDVASIVNLIVKYLFIAGGVVFFALILFSGFKLAFMSDKKKALDSVKQYLTTGVIGLIIMFAAYWIVQIIGFFTGIKIL